MNSDFQQNAHFPTLKKKKKKKAVQRGQKHFCASKHHPAMVGIHGPLFCLPYRTLRFLARTFYAEKRRAVCDPSLCNWSHLLLLHYIKCKSAPCRMLLYLLAIKTDYQSENTTSDVRQEDCFSLRNAIYLPGNTGSCKS